MPLAAALHFFGLTNGVDRGKLCCSAQILAFDSVLMLPKLQTAGETFTTCLWHTDEPGDTLLLNYSIPRQPPPPPPPPTSLFLLPPPSSSSCSSSALLLLLFSLSSHSLCCVLRFFTLHKIQTGPSRTSRPPRMSIKPICFIATGYRRRLGSSSHTLLHLLIG